MAQRYTEGARLLREQLKDRVWSQGRLARELGVDSGLVNRWVHGLRLPGRALSLRIASLIGVPAESWDTIAEKPPPDESGSLPTSDDEPANGTDDR